MNFCNDLLHETLWKIYHILKKKKKRIIEILLFTEKAILIFSLKFNFYNILKKKHRDILKNNFMTLFM